MLNLREVIMMNDNNRQNPTNINWLITILLRTPLTPYK